VTSERSAGPPRRTVVLGLGNILLGDEGVGVHVVEELRPKGLSGVGSSTAARPASSFSLISTAPVSSSSSTRRPTGGPPAP
jgi:hypothetical protein